MMKKHIIFTMLIGLILNTTHANWFSERNAQMVISENEKQHIWSTGVTFSSTEAEDKLDWVLIEPLTLPTIIIDPYTNNGSKCTSSGGTSIKNELCPGNSINDSRSHAVYEVTGKKYSNITVTLIDNQILYPGIQIDYFSAKTLTLNKYGRGTLSVGIVIKVIDIRQITFEEMQLSHQIDFAYQ